MQQFRRVVKFQAKMIVNIQTVSGFIIKKAEDGLLQNRYSGEKRRK